MARRLGVYAISPHQLGITAAKRLHAAGVRVVPWTASSKVVWRRLVAAGVDGIIRDDPLALVRDLRRRTLHPSLGVLPPAIAEI